MANQPQGDAEARLGQEAAVFRVGNLPYLAQDVGSNSCLLKELDGNLARDDAEAVRVGLVEEGAEVLLLLLGEVQDGVVCEERGQTTRSAVVWGEAGEGR